MSAVLGVLIAGALVYAVSSSTKSMKRTSSRTTNRDDPKPPIVEPVPDPIEVYIQVTGINEGTFNGTRDKWAQIDVSSNVTSTPRQKWTEGSQAWDPEQFNRIVTELASITFTGQTRGTIYMSRAPGITDGTLYWQLANALEKTHFTVVTE